MGQDIVAGVSRADNAREVKGTVAVATDTYVVDQPPKRQIAARNSLRESPVDLTSSLAYVQVCGNNGHRNCL